MTAIDATGIPALENLRTSPMLLAEALFFAAPGNNQQV
jgi:hypothetical protein